MSGGPGALRPCEACGTLTPRPDPDHSVLCGDCWVLDQSETMAAEDVQAMVLDTLMRNLGMVGTYTVPGSTANWVHLEDVRAMLDACAANLAQMLGGRVLKTDRG